MGLIASRRFTHPAFLREIAPIHALGLLRPHGAFFAQHGVNLPDDPDRLDYDAMAAILLQPYPDTPLALLDALWHIHEMDSPRAMDTLLDEFQRLGIEPDPRSSPADIAAQLWMTEPDVLRRKHAEQAVVNRVVFESFAARDGPLPEYKGADAATRARLEADLAAWFRSHHRGEGTRVFVFEDAREVRLIVRHGGAYRREGQIEDGQPTSVEFRPLVFTLIVFDRRVRELRISGGSYREKRALCTAIGRDFFGQPDLFQTDANKYTLEPLRRDGNASLICSDIPGLRYVRLIELSVQLGGPFHRYRIERADDLFLALE